MKYFYLTVLITAVSTFAIGQTVINPPITSIEGITIIDSDVVAYSFVVNQSSEMNEYQWERNIIEISEAWGTAVCDLNLCHFSGVEQATFFLGGEMEGTMNIHVYPNGVSGAAIIEIEVTNVNDEEDSAIATYYFNEPLSVNERITNVLKIYPNPVVSEFFIEGADDVQRIEIYNISGKLVKEVQSFGQGSVNVDGLGTGNYIVRMWNDANVQLSTNVLMVQ